MYSNLATALEMSGKSYKQIAETVGMTRAELKNKINNEEFSIEEAFRIKDKMCLYQPIEYLFESQEAEPKALKPINEDEETEKQKLIKGIIAKLKILDEIITEETEALESKKYDGKWGQ